MQISSASYRRYPILGRKDNAFHSVSGFGNQKVMFCGLSAKENFCLAQKAMSYVKSLNLRSDTRLEYELRKLLDGFNQFSPLVISKLGEKAFLLKDQIKEVKKLGFLYVNKLASKNYRTPDDFVDEAVSLSTQFHYGNCGPQTLQAAKFLNDSVKFHDFSIVNADIVEKHNCDKYFKDTMNGKIDLKTDGHTFMIMGLNRDFNVNNPKTWVGNLILDIWAGKIAFVDESLSFIEELRKLFRLDQDKDFVFINWVDEIGVKFANKNSVYTKGCADRKISSQIIDNHKI